MEFEIGEIVRVTIAEDIVTFFKIADVGRSVLKDPKGNYHHKANCDHLSEKTLLNLIRVLED